MKKIDIIRLPRVYAELEQIIELYNKKIDKIKNSPKTPQSDDKYERVTVIDESQPNNESQSNNKSPKQYVFLLNRKNIYILENVGAFVSCNYSYFTSNVLYYSCNVYNLIGIVYFLCISQGYTTLCILQGLTLL